MTKILSQKKYNIVNGEDDCSEKRLTPVYTIESYIYYSNTRVAIITFNEFVRYRTIERYEQYNYQKYPIYSEWKTKEYITERRIRLTNEELENLNQNEDFLIRGFAHQIVFRMCEKELYPSWFVMDMLSADFLARITGIHNYYNDCIEKRNIEIKNLEREKNNNNEDIKKLKEEHQYWHGKEIKQIRTINNCKAHKKSLFLSVVTLGIYSYYISKRNIERMSTKYYNYSNSASIAQQKMEILKLDNERCQKEIYTKIKDIECARSNCDYYVNQEQQSYNKKLAEVKELPKYQNTNAEKFTPLKMLVGLKLKKIMGCYIIHNRENNKYYVGQSKDVYKRLNQHFRGTEPQNHIFAQDYYCSSWKNKSDLFEVKVIPCSTRDELDVTEKCLIEEYDAWAHGYNGTRGNN